VRLLMRKIAYDGALPFAPLVPNKRTIAAVDEVKRGDLEKFKTVGALMADLNEDD
jgi:DNA-damage-inducible protein J